MNKSKKYDKIDPWKNTSAYRRFSFLRKQRHKKYFEADMIPVFIRFYPIQENHQESDSVE